MSPTLQPIRSARDRLLSDWIERSRGDADLVVVDGPKLVEEALSARTAAEAILFTRELDEERRGALLRMAGSLPSFLLDDRLEKPLTGTSSPRGVALLCRRPPAPSLEELRGGASPLLLVLDGIQDPGNAGALVRVAEAAGVTGIALSSGSARAFSPRAVRAAAGSALRLPILEKLDCLAGPSRPDGWNQIALDAGSSTPIDAPPPPFPLAIVAGSEGRGLSGRFGDAEGRRIPMSGGGSSLAVLSAVSVALFVITGFGGGAPTR
jgi:TrmH family RNA methyltransferase